MSPLRDQSPYERSGLTNCCQAELNPPMAIFL